MTNVPSGPTDPPNPTLILSYAVPTMRRSRLALWSMILGIIAIPATFIVVGIALGFVALITGIIALIAMHRNHYLGGRGMAITGIVTGGVSFLIMPILVVIAVAVPPLSRARELANRSACAVNLAGIVKGLSWYANENADQFPIVQYAPYSPALNNSSGVAVGNPAATLASYYGTGSTNQAGSPTACLWILVPKGFVSPKEFICKSDPTSPAYSDATNLSGSYYDNFQSGKQFSYSVMYPWDSAGEVSPAWKANVDASLPILSDIAPLNGTGTPVRDLDGPKGSGRGVLNSVNHGGDGQNVAFADGHVDFDTNPYVGQGDDNIWTRGGARSGRGTPVTPGPISITTTAVPFDTVMVPIRNASTGGM